MAVDDTTRADGASNDSDDRSVPSANRRRFVRTTGALGAGAVIPGLGAASAQSREGRSVDDIVADLSDREKVGQLVMALVSPTDDGEPPARAEDIVKDLAVGSAMVEHVGTPERTAEFNNTLQAWALETEAALPLLVGADFEFGAAHSVGDLRDDRTTQFPRTMNLGALGSERAAADAATITATEARAMGYHWGFAPVADVNTNPENPVIGVRAFGGDADLVASLTAAQAPGFQRNGNGIIATAKHFPGHGDTHTDSHTGLPTVSYDRDTLDAIHLPPFRAAIDAGIDAIMTAHIVVEAIDPDRPATLSEPVLTGLLRNELGYDGLLVTDAMSMQAITDIWGQERAAVLAASAGADVIMSMGGYEDHAATVEALYDAVQRGELSMERVEAAATRVVAAKRKYGLLTRGGGRPSGRVFVNPERAARRTGKLPDRRRAAEIARKSMTLVKNDGVLPFDATGGRTTLVAGVAQVDVLTEAVRDRSDGEVVAWQSSQWRDDDPTDDEIETVTALAEEADRALVATYSASELPDGQAELVASVRGTGTPTAAVSVGLPYDVASYPDVDAYLASYALDRWKQLNVSALEGVAEVVFGAEPEGTLPVEIDGHYPLGHGLGYEG
ncbi:glycoside hydrolase family 3 protein [Halosolutus gelatinilyticus]|uniref:glycoside hydrolase family 3 protein n=1 Tax=Halosolutus gelatinilyticus TaxID=2931975 RepID=UPI001FF59145|nr:glycoside hydrolase family 3 protein [Halosolutus gelatinilyticus]